MTKTTHIIHHARDPLTEDVHDDPAGLLIFSNSSRYDDVLAPPGESAVECDVKPSYSKRNTNLYIQHFFCLFTN